MNYPDPTQRPHVVAELKHNLTKQGRRDKGGKNVITAAKLGFHSHRPGHTANRISHSDCQSLLGLWKRIKLSAGHLSVQVELLKLCYVCQEKPMTQYGTVRAAREAWFLEWGGCQK